MKWQPISEYELGDFKVDGAFYGPRVLLIDAEEEFDEPGLEYNVGYGYSSDDSLDRKIGFTDGEYSLHPTHFMILPEGPS